MTVFKNRLMKNSSIIATLLLIILIATASFLSGRKIYSMERQRNLELLHNELRILFKSDRQSFEAFDPAELAVLFDGKAPTGLAGLTAIPLVDVGGSLCGILAVENPTRGEGGCSMLRSVSYSFSMLCQNLCGYITVIAKGEIDALTGLFNRNRFEHDLPGLSGAYADSLACVYIDTDDSAQTVEPSVYEEAVTQSGAATATQTAGTEPTADTETEPELPEEKPFSLGKIAVTLKDGSKASFWIYTPKNASPGMPMIVYLHGGSGKGEDLELLMKSNSLPLYLRESRLGEIPAYIVMPQAGSDILGWRDEAATLIGLIDYCEESCGIDLDNVSLTGHSMGGTGTWELAVLYPERFARIAPMSGSVADTEEI